MFNNLRIWFEESCYLLSCNVDEEAHPEPHIYDITIWQDGRPIDTFTPAEAHTPIREAALEEIQSAYQIDPLLENEE
ncbi:MAG TPA: hypothetical protein VKP88_02130 [Candidatus Paceibacterota bacterium]|nr:hypothetical protein [Candidatus Paceibacterota bacterium]